MDKKHSIEGSKSSSVEVKCGTAKLVQFKKFELCLGCQKIWLDQVPYGEPRLTFQRMYWLICRSLLNRHLTNTLLGYMPRINTGWTSTNVGQYIDRDVIDSVSAKAYWSNTGQLPVVYWSTVGLVSVASREIVDR